MTEMTLVYSLGRHTCAHSCSKVMRKALAPARCRQIDLADPPRRFAYAEDARNACLTSSPAQPWGTARREKCMLHRGITSMAGCVRCARCPAQRPSPTTREFAALRGASRPAARCGKPQSPHTTTSTTAPVERVSSGADAIKWALRGLFHSFGGVPYVVFFFRDGTQGEW